MRIGEVLQLQVQMVLTKALNDMSDMLTLINQLFGVNQDGIIIDNKKMMAELLEHLNHEGLKDGWGDGESIWNNPVFIVP